MCSRCKQHIRGVSVTVLLAWRTAVDPLRTPVKSRFRSSCCLLCNLRVTACCAAGTAPTNDCTDDILPDGHDLPSLEALLDAVLGRKQLAEQLVFPSAWWNEALPEARELIAGKLRPQYSDGLPSNDAVYFLSKTWARCASSIAI